MGRPGAWFDGIVWKAANSFAPEKSAAEDLAQEAYLALLRGARHFFQKEKPQVDDFKLAKAIVRNKLRREVKRYRPQGSAEALPLMSVRHEPLRLPDPGAVPDDTKVGKTARAILASDGFSSQAEVARRLGVSTGTVCRAVRRIREVALA